MPKRKARYDDSGQVVPFENARKTGDDQKLRNLMLKACPPDPTTGEKSIRILAKALEVSRQALTRSAANNSITVKRAQSIVDVADGRVTLSDFSPFYLM